MLREWGRQNLIVKVMSGSSSNTFLKLRSRRPA
jgi:hypothetical protein